MTNGGSLHDLSYELGRNAEGLESLSKAFERHEQDDDRRHIENVALLTANNEKIDELIKRLAPIFASHALTKRRMALVATVGISLLVGLSWAIEAAMKWAIDALLKIKFGG